MIQIRKVIEHVYEKVLGQGSETGSQSGNGGDNKTEKEKSSDSALTEDKVELLCNDQVKLYTNFRCIQNTVISNLHEECATPYICHTKMFIVHVYKLCSK